MKCQICNTTTKNMPQHGQSEKHKCLSNLVLYRYIVKDIAVDKFEDIITSYFIEHIKKFHTFSAVIFWVIDDETKYKVSIPNRNSFALDV